MTKPEFEEFVLANRTVLYSVSYGLLPNPSDQDDAVQECIRIALQKRESLREDRFAKTWLIRILINECYTILRKRKREFPSEEIPVVVPQKANPAVFEAVMELPDKQKIPTILYYLEGYTTNEIAKILHIPVGTVKSRLIRARKLLQVTLDEEEAWL